MAARRASLRRIGAGAAALALALWAGAALAAPLALVIGNSRYEGATFEGGDDVADTAGALEQAGIEVVRAQEADREAVMRAVAEFARRAPDADRVLVALSGRFLRAGTDSWFLPLGARGESLLALPEEALPLSIVLSILSEHPGRAILLLGHDRGAGGAIGPYLHEGIGRIVAPRGVSVIRAGPRQAAALIEDTLVRPGASITRRARRTKGVRIAGYAPRDLSFLPAEAGAPALEAAPPTDAGPGTAARSEEAWRRAEEADTVAAYEAYIGAHPTGRHVDAARLRIATLRDAPQEPARSVEEGMGLDAERRQAIQRDLSLLGHDTRGIDGIFGPGTRSAIRAWQEASGRPVTGYLAPRDLEALSAQAREKAGVLEAQRLERVARLDARDREDWSRTGATGTIDGLREYLRLQPDGRYAERARDELDRLVRDPARAGREEMLWNQARDSGVVAAYVAYLEEFPDGQHAAPARDWLRGRGVSPPSVSAASSAGVGEAAIARAEAGERALGLNAIAGRAVEARLASLDLDPGPVDGVFDARTRRALRGYQRGAGLAVTGYLDQPTAVRLLAETVREALR